MKKMIKYTGVFLVAVSLVSCENFLDEVPKSNASIENFYKTAEHAEAAVVGAYNALQREGVYGHKQQYLVTDLTRCAEWNTYGGIGTYSFSSDNADVIKPLWQDHYKGINEANAAINNIPNVEMDEQRRNTLIAEARFLRSLLYFNLIRYFGDVPYLEEETGSLNDLLVPRTPVGVIYEKLIADLEFCIEHLSIKGETEPGRATVGSAKALLSKIYLTRGSMAKRDGTGDGLADFEKAAQLSGEVIASGQYALCDYFPDAFIVENKNNDEILFDVQFKGGGIGEGTYIGMHMGLGGKNELGGSWNNITSTEYFHTIYEPTDMVRQEWTSCHVTIAADGSLTVFTELQAQPWRIGKFRRYPVRNPDFVWSDHDINWPVFRYAEVLLIYAEALNEVNNGPTEQVFDALNQLRRRARNVNGDGTREALRKDVLPRSLTYVETILPDISEVEYPDYESMFEYIMDERGRELGGETKRWFDLVRWGKLVGNIKFLLTHIPEGRKFPERKNYNIAANNVAEHHMLLPIPLTDIQANPMLKQNPGY